MPRPTLPPAALVPAALLAVSLATSPARAAAPAAAPPAGVAAALAACGLDAAALPATYYLVRAAEAPAPAPGLVVHGRSGSTWVVSGPPAAIAALAEGRCLVRRVEAGGAAAAAAAPAPRALAAPAAPDPVIQALADSVTWARVSAKIGQLSSFPTRNSNYGNCAAAAETLRVFFERLGLTTEWHSFPYNSRTLRNLIATQPGTTHPDSLVVIGAHYDDMPATGAAPGADDNASGVAAVMTAAELLSRHRFAYTIKYVCFGGEEQGLLGSTAMAPWAAAQGWRVVAVLACDMLGWWTPGVEDDLEVEVGTSMVWLGDLILDAAALYTTQPCHLHVDNGAWWGDQVAFWQQGWAGANHEEAWDWGDPDFNPRYHTSGDRLIYLDPGYTVGCTRVALAALATLARRDPLSGLGDAPRAAAVTLRAHPNPFNPRVSLEFALAADGRARVAVYDLAGRRVAALADRAWTAGRHAVTWDGRDDRGRPLPSGAYVARVEAAAGRAALKVVLAR